MGRLARGMRQRLPRLWRQPLLHRACAPTVSTAAPGTTVASAAFSAAAVHPTAVAIHSDAVHAAISTTASLTASATSGASVQPRPRMLDTVW